MAKKFKCNICGQTFEADSKPDKCPICQMGAEHIVELEPENPADPDGPAKPVEKKKGLNTNSNVYTVVYASVMVIIVAFLLAFISSSLKSRQDDNVANDKRSQILASLNLRDVQNVQDEYNKVVVKDIVVNVNGDVITENGGFDVDSKDITTKDSTAMKLPVYVCKVNNDDVYVVPLYGRGLWGGLWGYLALKPDFKTVYGCFLSHEGETAGLGARIVEPDFQKKFNDKVVFTDEAFTNVVLGVKKKVENPESQVDAITGATLTSNGVDEMFRTSLAPYKQYFLSNHK